MTATLLHILIGLHTLIAAVSTACVVYLYFAAWQRRSPPSDRLLRLALIWPLANLLLMAANGMVCPLQNAAQSLLGQHGGWVRDIYLVPQSWLKVVPWTYGPSYLLGAALVWWRARNRHGRLKGGHDDKP